MPFQVAIKTMVGHDLNHVGPIEKISSQQQRARRLEWNHVRRTHLVVVHAFATEMEAVIAKSALESAGIMASIRSDSWFAWSIIRSGNMTSHTARMGAGQGPKLR